MDDKRKRAVTLGALLVACVLLLAAVVYGMNATRGARERVRDELTRATSMWAESVSAILEGQYRVLDTIAGAISGDDGPGEGISSDMLSEAADYSGFSALLFIRPDGTIADESPANVRARDYFKDAMSGERGLERISRLQSGMPAIALSVPLRRGDETAGVLCGMYDAAGFAELLHSENSGDLTGMTLVELVNGEISGVYGPFSSDMLADVSYDGCGYDALVWALNEGATGAFRCGYDGQAHLITFAPLDRKILPDNDWYIFNSVPQSAIDGIVAASFASPALLLLILSACAALIAALTLVHGHIGRKRRASDKAAAASDLNVVNNACRDALTGLLTRDAFIAGMNQMISREKDSTYVLMLVDIDDFRSINETKGRVAGDAVLREFAKHMRSVLRNGDLIGRVGGDEFMICIVDMPYDAAILAKAEQLCAALYMALDERLSVSASIGIAIYPRDGLTFDELDIKAGAALAYAQGNGKNTYAMYSVRMLDHPGHGGGARPGGMSDGSASHPARASLPARKTVMLACGSAELSDEITHMLSGEYELLAARDSDDARQLLSRTGDISAIVLDMDADFSMNMLGIWGAKGSMDAAPVLAISEAIDDDSISAILEAGASGVISKPVSEKLLQLRIRLLITHAERERRQLQRNYHRLQRTDEVRYREVLNATGTAVFIYAPETRSYEFDDLAGKYIAGNFDGRRLIDVLMQDKVASDEDILEGERLVKQVAGGEIESAEMNVKVRTPEDAMRWFHVQISRMRLEDELTQKLLIIVNDANDKVEADEKLRFRAERDPLTGLYNRETFFEKAGELIDKHAPGEYTLSCFDVDNFKVLNDQRGVAFGDRLLKNIAAALSEGATPGDWLCCRISADIFALLYPTPDMTDEVSVRMRERARLMDGTYLPITFSVGRYSVDDLSLPVSAMYDRAYMAKSSVKGRYDIHVAQYDEAMREHIINEQRITSGMDAALANREFMVWLQPQYELATNALIGAEALVRWMDGQGNMLSPGLFIPLFERNGFIYNLDRFVWEETCALLRKWTDEGRDPLPVSVNVSRFDIFQEDFFDTITGLVEKYRLPREMLRIEITESAFSKSSGQIIEVVKRLREHGFVVEIDDFGSGYSSLNTLKDVHADILKLDMRFLENGENARRGGNITESVLRMAKRLDMPVIAEGVETREEADYLRSIGCEYAQGFLYARPMPIDEYETLLATGDRSVRRAEHAPTANLDNDAFWDPKSQETLIFNSYVGGACVFEYHEGVIELLRVNDKYIETLDTGLTVTEVLKADMTRHFTPDDYERLTATVERAMAADDEASCEVGWFNDANGDKRIDVYVTLRVIAHSVTRALVYASIQNITAQRDAERMLRDTSEKLQTIMNKVDSGVSATIVEGDSVEYSFANDYYYEMLGYTPEQFRDEVTDIYQLIFAEDREELKRLVTNASLTGKSFSHDYRAIRRDGRVIWLKANVSIAKFSGMDRPVQFSVVNDITAEKQLQRYTEDLLDNMPCGAGIYQIDGDKLKLLYLNRKYGEMVNRDRYRYMGTRVYDSMHPDDVPRVRRAIDKARRENVEVECGMRVICGNGDYTSLHANIKTVVQDDGSVMAYVVFTRAKEGSREMLEMIARSLSVLMDSSRDMVFVKDATLAYICVSHTFADLAGLTSAKDAISRTDADIFSPARAARYTSLEHTMLSTPQKSLSTIEKFTAPDHTERCFFTTRYLLTDGDGLPVGLCGIGREVS